MNRHCPHDVIELLINKYPAALRHFSVIGSDGVYIEGSIGCDDIDYEVSGLPLHYYLSRPSEDIDMETVIMLVDEYPKALTSPPPMP